MSENAISTQLRYHDFFFTDSMSHQTEEKINEWSMRYITGSMLQFGSIER